MAYNFSAFKQKIKAAEEHLTRELSQVRTGRAAPMLLDSVKVEAYGSLMPLKEVAAVNIEDPRTLRVAPWDASQVKAIEKALTSSNLGLSVAVDEKGVRVSFPELTSERRHEMVKIAKGKLEDARVSIRGERDAIWGDIQGLERDGKMGEDDKFRAKEEMQKLVDEANKNFESQIERKEKEILS